jgi:Holliday junction resolvase-like predicted endonuclease
MNVELQMLITVLELTRDGSIAQETINKHARIPMQVAKELLQRMHNDHLIYLHDNFVEASDIQRLEMAVRALTCGADLERVSDLLQWKEFEGMAAFALENNGYLVQRNVRFKHGGRRWEIDVVGLRKPLVICIDCKHWHHRLCESTTKKIVNEQIARVRALAISLPNPAIQIVPTNYSDYKLLPVVLSLIVEESKFFGGVPIVPILQLQDFLNHLPTWTDSLFCINSNSAKAPKSHQKKLADWAGDSILPEDFKKRLACKSYRRIQA